MSAPASLDEARRELAALRHTAACAASEFEEKIGEAQRLFEQMVEINGAMIQSARALYAFAKNGEPAAPASNVVALRPFMASHSNGGE